MRNALSVAMPEKRWRFIVFDNGGETVDRYTVFFRSNGWQVWREYFALNDMPTDPQGFSQYGDIGRLAFDTTGELVRFYDNHRLGKRIRFRALPANVQDHIYARLED